MEYVTVASIENVTLASAGIKSKALRKRPESAAAAAAPILGSASMKAFVSTTASPR